MLTDASDGVNVPYSLIKLYFSTKNIMTPLGFPVPLQQRGVLHPIRPSPLKHQIS